MLLADVVATSAAVAAAPGRKAKTAALAALLARAEPEEVAPVVAWLAGELTQRQVGVGWATLKDPPPPAPAGTTGVAPRAAAGETAGGAPGPAAGETAGGAPGPAAGETAGDAPDALGALAVGDVEAALTRIGALRGSGSQGARRDAVRGLLGAATAPEQAFLQALLSGGLRQGALAGLMADAVAEVAGLPKAGVKRALTLHGDLTAIARIALTQGAEGLRAVRLEVGRPLAPMLAATAPDVATALATTGPAAVDAKLDGARVQVHRDGDEVRVFTRTLDDVTARLPEVVALALSLPASTLVLDAEAIALKPDGRPEPFQVTASRFGSVKARDVPLATLVFDVLHLDGEDLLDLPLAERTRRLVQLVPAAHRIPRTLVDADAVAAQRALDAALAAGHEGVVVKALADPYAAGRRAKGWQKVKPVHTFDLVVLGAEWGHGRRRGTLSNLHLGARDGDGFAMVGKTFKGLTDALLAWQTERLLQLEVERRGIAVLVRPELVVEIAVDGVQTSRRYPAGAALRFARVKRYRPDKPAAEADTLHDVLALRDR